MASAFVYDEFGDPDATPGELTPEQKRKQRRAEREGEVNRECDRLSHFHRATAGENIGGVYSHSHGGDEPGHMHAEHMFPLRADGGFWQESGPSLGHEMPEDVAIEVRARLTKVLRSLRPTNPAELVTWRMRLYCGHVVERPSHQSNRSYSPLGRIKCPECEMDPSTVLAAIVVR